VCGKNTISSIEWRDEKGSPPRVREELGLYAEEEAQTRITPACAGRTHAIKKYPDIKKDHPRVCGKNILRTLR